MSHCVFHLFGFSCVQVKKVKDQALSKEDSLQTKISELEAEKSRKDNELRLLRQSKQTVSIVILCRKKKQKIVVVGFFF